MLGSVGTRILFKLARLSIWLLRPITMRGVLGRIVCPAARVRTWSWSVIGWVLAIWERHLREVKTCERQKDSSRVGVISI